MSAGRATLMWEAAAHPGRGPELVDWARAAVREELDAEVAASARIFTSSDDRVVIIATSPEGSAPRLHADPGELVRRPPHQWPFVEV